MAQPDVRDAAKMRAAEAVSEAKDGIYREAKRRTDELGDDVAERAQEMADAATAAAAQFDPHSLQAEAVRHIADRVEGAADKIRTADLDTIVRDVSEFARRNPLVFVGAAAAIGFAATRFLKAEAPASSGGHPDRDVWGSPGNAPGATNFQSAPANVNGDQHA